MAKTAKDYKARQVTVGDMTMKVTAVGYHRNGVGGDGFHVVLFDWTDKDGNKPILRHMVATYRPEVIQDGKDGGYYRDKFSPDVEVLDLDECKKGNISYAMGNMWRGDHFEPCIRKAIKDADPKGWRGGEGGMMRYKAVYTSSWGVAPYFRLTSKELTDAIVMYAGAHNLYRRTVRTISALRMDAANDHRHRILIEHPERAAKRRKGQ